MCIRDSFGDELYKEPGPLASQLCLAHRKIVSTVMDTFQSNAQRNNLWRGKPRQRKRSRRGKASAAAEESGGPAAVPIPAALDVDWDPYAAALDELDDPQYVDVDWDPFEVLANLTGLRIEADACETTWLS